MSHVRMTALVGAILVAGAAFSAPAQAEFFGCNDRPGKVLSDSSWHSRASRPASRMGSLFAPPRQQRVIYSSAPRYSHYR